MKHLKKINAPADVIAEFERPMNNPNMNHKLEITDINTLIEMDEFMDEQGGASVFMEQKKYSELQKTKLLIERKPDQSLVCSRCHQLKSQNKLLHYETPEKPEAGQAVQLSDHVAQFNREEIIRNVFKQIYSRSIIVYVIDIMNFEGSQIEEIYDLINNGKHRVLLVVNKIDALPLGFNVQNLQLWVKRQIEAKIGEDITWNICLSSSKKATGMAKVLEILKKWKAQMAGMRYKPKVYVLGCTNSGKSTFINALLFKANKYKDPKKVHYRQKYDILTESPAPGTTLDFVTVEEFKLGFRVIDTPGIPNMNQVSAHVSDYEDMLTVLPSKRVQSFSMNIRQGYSVWLGGLCRLDVLSGADKYYTFYVPQNVTIHRTPFDRAEQVYLDRAGTLLRPTYDEKPESIEFEQRPVQLECDSFTTANYDISIEGLGWFSIQGVGFVDMFINLPFGIRHHVRSSAMRPWEIKDKRGLDRYTGMTVAAKTKKNQKLGRKFEMKKEE